MEVGLLELGDPVHQRPVAIDRASALVEPGPPLAESRQVDGVSAQLRGAGVADEASVDQPSELRLQVGERWQHGHVGTTAQLLLGSSPGFQAADHVAQHCPLGCSLLGGFRPEGGIGRFVTRGRPGVNHLLHHGGPAVLEQLGNGGVRRPGETELLGVGEPVQDCLDWRRRLQQHQSAYAEAVLGVTLLLGPEYLEPDRRTFVDEARVALHLVAGAHLAE